MAVNPDPKPGRWILPLVILAMIAFTYFFVSALPEASPDTTLAAPSSTSTTVEDSSGTTTPGSGGGTVPVSGDTAAYLAELDSVNAELQVLETEMVTVNAGFDADPREITYDEAGTRLDAVVASTQDLAARVAALTVPAGLEANQTALQSAIDFAAGAAQDAATGLRSTDTGELRRSAVEAYTTSASDFDTEVQNTKNAASG